ncbi:MAG: hydrogenase maturation protease [Anaerolineae bacterium]|nr:hydrogenase maturation protease [Anaerolineae bacterium]
MNKRLAVIGLGNPLRGDDGVGPWVIAELTRQGLPPGVTAYDGGTAGLDLLRLLDSWEQVIIVDAGRVGQEPGQFVRFTPDQARWSETRDTLSLHNMGLSEVLALARALERPLPAIVIFGMQPGDTDWGERFSPAVQAALPTLVRAIREEIGE